MPSMFDELNDKPCEAPIVVVSRKPFDYRPSFLQVGPLASFCLFRASYLSSSSFWVRDTAVGISADGRAWHGGWLFSVLALVRLLPFGLTGLGYKNTLFHKVLRNRKRFGL